MRDIIISWALLLVLLVVAFGLLSRYQRRRPPVRAITVLLHIGCVCISLCLGVVCATLLYEPIVAGLNINTDGFMNMNGILTLVVIWVAVCVLALMVIVKFKALWDGYYRTLRTAQIVFLLLPLLLIVVLLFVAGHK